jgi:lysyl-tRNA synthetase class 2
VFGIVLMMLAGTISFAGFAVSPIYEICAFAFGVGIGLTIDEFALWLYLDDVYWAKEGRSSIDATVIAVAFLGLVLMGTRPFDIDTNDAWTIVASIVSILLALSWVVIALLKGRVLHAAIGFFLFPFSLYATCRIAKPTSWWAKRYYGERNPGKQAKAEKRFAADRRTERFKETMRDAIGGSPEEIYLAKIETHENKSDAPVS